VIYDWAVEDAICYLANDIFYRDPCTLIAEIGTSFVSSPCGIEGSIVGEDLKGNHLEVMEDSYKNMEDFIIQGFADANTEMREGALRRDMLHGDASIGTVRSASVFIMEHLKELTHILMAVHIPKQIQEKQTRGIITGRAERGITISH